MRYELIINGIDGPTRKLFGCGCGRCLSHGRQANTSASLLTYNDRDQLAHHLLIDAGSGVADSLVSHPCLHGEKARLDGILLTHWHPDHTINLNPIVVSHRVALRNRGVVTSETMPRIPVWCRRATAAHLQRTHAYDYTNLWQPLVTDEMLPPGHILPPVELAPAGVGITPVTVSHFTADIDPIDRTRTAYGCAAFVLETAQRKIVLLWDIDNQNDWLREPQNEAQAAAVDLLSDADQLFIDTAFWHTRTRPTTHPGFEQVMQIAARLRPCATQLVHMSGHPDLPGNKGYGWDNGRWQTEARRAWTANHLPGTVHVPAIGQTFPLQ